jgi:hypothetical protein
MQKLKTREVTSLLRERATLILDRIDGIHEPIAMLSDNLGFALGLLV